MLARQDERELDRLLAGAFEEALAREHSTEMRAQLIGRFAQASRQLALHPVRARVFQALRGGSRYSFFEIVKLVEGHFERLKPSRRWMGGTLKRVSQARSVVEPLLTPGEVAKELGVSARTVTNWCKKGLLAYVELESGHRRIPERALEAYRQSRGHWAALDEAAARARGDQPEPSEDEVFAELAKRGSKAT